MVSLLQLFIYSSISHNILSFDFLYSVSTLVSIKLGLGQPGGASEVEAYSWDELLNEDDDEEPISCSD